MKNIIYGVVLVSLILLSFSVLLLYYTQDFSADIDFKKSISISDLELQKNDRGGVNYLNLASGQIGTLTLENHGYFTRIYRVPNLVGCINTKEGVSREDEKIRSFQFIIFYIGEQQIYSGNTIEIPIGKEMEFEIVGQYNAYDVPVYVFQDSTDSISIYQIPHREKNPLGEFSYVPYRYYENDCNLLRSELEPIEKIRFSS